MSEKLTDLELSMWIFERIFGAKWYKFTEQIKEEQEHLRNENGRWLASPEAADYVLGMKYWEMADGSEEITWQVMDKGFVPEYPKSLSEAWKVVEKMCEKGFYLLFYSHNNSARFYRTFKNDEGDVSVEISDDTVEAESMPRPICEAAKQILEKN